MSNAPSEVQGEPSALAAQASTAIAEDATINPRPAASSNNDWKRQLLDPSLVRRFMKDSNKSTTDAQGLFSSIPWVLHQEASSVESPIAEGQAFIHPDAAIYPNVHYLDLRREQNIQWADQRLREGIQYAQTQPQTTDLYTKALAAYQQGLELVPDHVNLLVALGALQANHGKYGAAIKLFQRALVLDPTHSNAQTYLNDVQSAMERKQQQQLTGGLTSKAARASLEASLERSMLAEDGTAAAGLAQHLASSYDEQYPLLDQGDTDDFEEKRHKKRSSHRKKRSKKSKDSKKHKKHRKKKHKRKRRRYSSSESTSSSSSSESVSISSDERHRKNSKRKRDRHQKECDDSISLMSRNAANNGDVATRYNLATVVVVDRVPLPDDVGDADDATATPKSNSTRDSLELDRTHNLPRLANRKDHDRGISRDSDEPTPGASDSRRPVKRSQSRSSDDGSGTVNSLDLVKSRKRRRPSRNQEENDT